MKIGFARFGVLLAALAGLLPASTVTVYYNQAAWQAAMSAQGNNPLTTIGLNSSQWTNSVEYSPTFTASVSQSTSAASNGMTVSADSQFSAPGYAALSTLGQVANGVWTDEISKYGSTTFNFSDPIYGFGGDFDILRGNGLYIAGVGDVGVGASGYDGFIGVVASGPVDSIFISWGDGGNTDWFSNSYTLSNFQVATLPTPEPNFGYGFAGLLAVAVSYLLWKRP